MSYPPIILTSVAPFRAFTSATLKVRVLLPLDSTESAPANAQGGPVVRDRILYIGRGIDDPVRGRQGGVAVDKLAVLGTVNVTVSAKCRCAVGGRDEVAPRASRRRSDLGLDRARGV